MESINDTLGSAKSRSGFTLIEVAFALAIVVASGLVLTLALERATRSTFQNRSIEDAARMEEAIRFGFRKMEFATVFAEFRDSEYPFFVYTYRAEKGNRRPDDSLKPSEAPGWIVTSGLRQTDDPLFKDDMVTSIGQAFRLRITPFDVDTETPYELPASVDLFSDSALKISVEVFQDFNPGIDDSSWPNGLRLFSFPMTIPRWN